MNGQQFAIGRTTIARDLQRRFILRSRQFKTSLVATNGGRGHRMAKSQSILAAYDRDIATASTSWTDKIQAPARGGDQDAFTALLSPLAPKLHRLARRLAGSFMSIFTSPMTFAS